jgi:hypothetical protein
MLFSFNAIGEFNPVHIYLRAKQGGNNFKWSKLVGGAIESKKIETLETEPFLTNADFKEVKIVELKSPPSLPNSFEIELFFSEAGKNKYTAIANKDRDREYCLLFENEVYQCSAFPPASKGLWDKSFSIYGPFTKTKAEELSLKFKKAIAVK